MVAHKVLWVKIPALHTDTTSHDLSVLILTLYLPNHCDTISICGKVKELVLVGQIEFSQLRQKATANDSSVTPINTPSLKEKIVHPKWYCT